MARAQVPTKEQKATTAFEIYDRENPQIWKMFLRLAVDAHKAGMRHWSAKGIFEVIRYQTAVGGTGEYKLNNNYTADYARKLLNLYPKKFEGFFNMRHAARVPA